jgi:hypothetical protein
VPAVGVGEDMKIVLCAGINFVTERSAENMSTTVSSKATGPLLLACP